MASPSGGLTSHPQPCVPIALHGPSYLGLLGKSILQKNKLAYVLAAYYIALIKADKSFLKLTAHAVKHYK